jgi:hypothetical protein
MSCSRIAKKAQKRVVFREKSKLIPPRPVIERTPAPREVEMHTKVPLARVRQCFRLGSIARNRGMTQAAKRCQVQSMPGNRNAKNAAVPDP